MIRRTRLPLILGMLITLGSVALLAQVPPRSGFPVEELDPNPPKKFQTILVDEDLPEKIPEGAYFVRLRPIAQSAAQATDRRVQQFLNGLTTAFDRVTLADGRVLRVTPLPLLFPNDRKKFPDPFGVVPLNSAQQPGEVDSLAVKSVRRIEPFEQIAVSEVDRLLAEPDGPSVAVRLAACEIVLARVLLFHSTARDQNRRRGEEWQPLADALQTRLTDVRIARVNRAVEDRDWPLVRTLATELLADPQYARNRAVLEPILAARLAEAESVAKSGKIPDLEQLRNRLTAYDAQFPESKNPVAVRVRVQLHERADKLFQEAERIAATDPSQAQNLLKTVEALNPDQPGLRNTQRDLKAGYSILIVGTCRLPERMSPATARFDSERQAVELLFEGLLAAVPDLPPSATGDDAGGLGIRYVPHLAADRPQAADGTRDFPLVLSALWANPSFGRFDPADVVDTVALLQQTPGNWAADAADWLGKPTIDPHHPAHVQLHFRRSHPDPRSLLTFKILPARWFQAHGFSADDLQFAQAPVGTGPFRLERGKGSGNDVVFVSNPSYGRRPGCAGLPLIKEVRFTDITAKPDLPAEFRGDRLHLLTDVPTAELPRYQAEGFLGGRVRIVTAQTPRQFHYLAVNHRRPALQSVDLRRGLSLAIDREQILNTVFRAGQNRYHKAMTGPFLPGCWASPAVPLDPLHDGELATAKLKAYRMAGGPATLSLAFPNDDPSAQAACEAIRAAVSATESGVRLELVPLPPQKLVETTEQLHAYDLAYLPFRYPNDWYPQTLASLLDPNAAQSHGRNLCGYLVPGTHPTPADDALGRLLSQARFYQDVDGKLLPLAHEIHHQFNTVMPFIPLWRLDRHMVIASSLKIRLDGWNTDTPAQLLDFGTLFGSIAHWDMR
ncbi:MAG: ABC transporter substrate-binding protein [Bacteroidales bacterium]|nr:ABC transporter substrate-binding protein [Bacteroidales bacterium]